MPIQGIKIDGLRELQKRAHQDGPAAKKELREASKEAATMVRNAAVPLAPRGKTRRLAKSVGVVVSQTTAAVKAGSATRVPYAGPVHFGWPLRGIAAQPFLYRAMKGRLRAIRQNYERRIERLAQRLPERRFGG